MTRANRNGRIGWLTGTIPLAVGVGLGIATVWWILGSSGPQDVDAYWHAAIRLREGQPLYLAADANAPLVYRYAPWFAWLWVPLTYLPQPLVYITWRLTLFAAAGWIGIQPLSRWALALIMPFLALAAWWGNVQPLLVAGLVYGLGRRSGPMWIAIAASLKAAPFMFALVYLARRQWWQFSLSAGLTLILVAPMALYDLSGYTTDPSSSISLWFQVSPWAWLTTLGIACALMFWRPSWFTGGVAVVAALPRLLLYDFSFLLPGVRHGPSR